MSKGGVLGEKLKECNPMIRRNVYINGLPYYFKSNDLRELCKVYGRIEASKLCASSHGPTARSYGFVLFVNEENAQTCIADLDGSPLFGHRLQARYADSKATPLPSYFTALNAAEGSGGSGDSAPTNDTDELCILHYDKAHTINVKDTEKCFDAIDHNEKK
uniref:Zinc finger CCHC-type and RNA-binding motif-containing protein 1 n=1 Tax=Lygus hesperus TaxID=30085 RepID=A0A0A9W619_LYGHE